MASVLKKIGKGIKKLGGLATKAAPVLGMIPGVGTLAAAGIGAAGGLASGGLKGALKGGLGGAAGGLAGGALGKLGGLSGIGSKLMGTGAGKAAGKALTGAVPIAKAAGRALTTRDEESGGLGLSGLGKLGMGAGMMGLDMLGQRSQNKQAGEWNQGILDMLAAGMGRAEGAYDAAAPMRSSAYEAIARGLSGQGDIFSAGAQPAASNQGKLHSALKRKAGR